MDVEAEPVCSPHRVKPKKGRMVCLDRDWDWAQKLLKKLTSQDAEAKQMKLDYSKCQ